MPSNFDDIRDGTNIWGNKAGGGQPGGPGGPGNGGECLVIYHLVPGTVYVFAVAIG